MYRSQQRNEMHLKAFPQLHRNLYWEKPCFAETLLRSERIQRRTEALTVQKQIYYKNENTISSVFHTCSE